MACDLCGHQAKDRDLMAAHLAHDHPNEWAMAVGIVALQLMGVP